MNITSTLYTLEEIVGEGSWKFSIPIYQRLYVWGKDQVDTLLNDFANAYEAEEDIFFLGGTLIVERTDNGKKHYELIDGQQRFTTLWILSYAWKEALESFISYHEGETEHTRIHFSIRHEVNRYLKSLALNAPEELSQETEKQTEKIRNAIARMKSFISDRTEEKSKEEKEQYVKGLTSFIYEKVKLVITEVPEQTDLNKLFEVINNRGVQLQHHEILKAKMLDVLEDSERASYASLWDATSDMDGFIERNLSGVVGKSLTGKELAELFDKNKAKEDREVLRDASQLLDFIQSKLNSGYEINSLSLSEILHPDWKSETDTLQQEDEQKESEPTWARSVIGFPLLLQHVLRIWLHDHYKDDLPKILDRELLALFDEHFFVSGDKEQQASFVKSFIQLLWEIRYIFDKHVIKWANPTGEEEIQQITSMRLIDPTSGAKSLNREKTESTDARELGMIQSFLYHSQEITTHYWLTPFLNFIHKHPSEVKVYIKYLKHLDNCLLGSELGGKLVERTKEFLKSPWTYYPPRHEASLIKEKGVHFWSYWFYKLEFVLWCARNTAGNKDSKWDKFRFTAKNSVEHISPQTPKATDRDKVDAMLNHFGNLALVSRSVNSEYSNLPFNEKRQRFHNNNRDKIDSLKMSLIYENEHWNDELAQSHQKDMIALMTQYYKDNTAPLDSGDLVSV